MSSHRGTDAPITFHALPVDRGDAFLLRDDGHDCLFDGGEYEGQVVGLLRAMEVSSLRIVICSHNDSDHANGILGVMKSSIHVCELWVPECWREFENMAATMKGWKRAAVEETLADASLLAVWRNYGMGDADAAESSATEPTLSDVIVGGGHTQSRERTEGGAPADIERASFLPSGVDVECQSGDLDNDVARQLTKAGVRIRQILGLARQRRCLVRYFACLADGNRSGRAVDATKFVPLSCVEITGGSTKSTVGTVLALTQINRRSLVFRHENGGGAPDVLFTADSGLGFTRKGKPICLPPCSIATAPHHGSWDKDNRSAYGKIQGKSLAWVRSGGTRNGIPCYEYTQQQTRYCTLCRGQTEPFQQVDLTWDGNQWKPRQGMRSCTC